MKLGGITRHAMERYVERIKGTTDKTERNSYITKNQERITQEIDTMFSYAEFVYRGKIGSKTTSEFYIFKDIVFVVTTEGALITIYKLNFSLPEELKETIIDNLKTHIIESGELFKAEKEKVDKALQDMEQEKQKIQNETIELNARIEALKCRKNKLEAEKDSMLAEVAVYSTQQNKYANMLFGNLEYKDDIKSLGK